jgi:type II secretory pathway pseudopilin PulG
MMYPMSRTPNPVGRQLGRRQAFTVMEVMVALGLLSVAMVLLSQIAVGELVERKRQQSRQLVLEAAANVLESARASPFESITPQWAVAQRLPEPLAARLLDAKLNVTVAPYSTQPKLKRVAVEITWRHEGNTPARPVLLTGFFSARTASQAETKP